VLNKLDQDPRDEFEDETEGARAGSLGDGAGVHANEIGLDGFVGFTKLK